MPGTVVDFDLWKRGVIAVKKPPFYFGELRPEELELRVTPPPLLMQAFGGDLDRLIYHMNRLTEDTGQAPCESRPKDTAFVTKPGPLLRDVMEELRQERTRKAGTVRTCVLVSVGPNGNGHTNTISTNRPCLSVSHDGMKFDDEARTSPRSTSRSTSQQATTHAPQPTPERPERVVQHRFTRRDNDPATAPRRIITLRGTRRGRPRRKNGKHGADPPA